MEIIASAGEGAALGGGCSEEIARFAAGAAVQGPSVHNTQPWRIAHSDRGITITAHSERQLHVAGACGRGDDDQARGAASC